jgi:hypothetical protein
MLLLALGCSGGAVEVPPTDGTEPTAATTGDTGAPRITTTTLPAPTAATGDTGTPSTGDTGDTGEPGLDCTVFPAAPVPTLLATPVSEEFAFDTSGNLVNVDDGVDGLFLTPYGGPPVLLAPYSAIELAGVAILLDGGIAIADEWNGAITRTDPVTGARTTIVSGLDAPNSMAVGADGLLYTTSNDEIRRYDLATGLAEPVALVSGADLDGLVFAPDFSALYFNSDEVGFVGRIPFDKKGVPQPVEPVATVPLTWDSELDGMAMDACGSLYAARTDGVIVRIRPDGTVDNWLTITGGFDLFTSSLHFGSGIGGWADDTLYVMDRSAGLWEVPVGIPGAKMPHLP